MYFEHIYIRLNNIIRHKIYNKPEIKIHLNTSRSEKKIHNIIVIPIFHKIEKFMKWDENMVVVNIKFRCKIYFFGGFTHAYTFVFHERAENVIGSIILSCFCKTTKNFLENKYV